MRAILGRTFLTTAHNPDASIQQAQRASLQPDATVRVLVVDDSETVRRALCRLLESQSDIEVICEASDGVEAVCKALEHKPDIVLMDVATPGLNGLDTTRRIKHKLPLTGILMIASSIPPVGKRGSWGRCDGPTGQTLGTRRLGDELRPCSMPLLRSPAQMGIIR